ncbi:arsenosugar biosynthesis radical SAM (seleno)protein ArsS [Clostridium algidicarnis]|uniref:arsenosugar biosynthesis radical SAM (seleno)protein ArsS n=1 Tax=Clostridium algidicarnis TaxID=37659 RepID=UPI001C0ABB7D|nr:arsenosugar biosynthesis radical SAM (seleno)protein ArsS [Clostridium algidicarnis]MBU3197089.1 arsenosugar biosynthesis radical SAM protein ArsS [Clostridium algidicarnis]MBU3227028.1 arsenosugar biosynthesis radical SAM protein ArsS [Clostridium algidicarnis]MBU3250554.1 arsenosugar biosynthesis radical SAM protein ArsS [Clostridium algidicarnis]
MKSENLRNEINEIPEFSTKIDNKDFSLTKDKLEIMQINVGKLCNLSCKHCHVSAGPNRKEIMSLSTMKDCLQVFKENNFTILDITGGAPEMNPNFKWLVKEACNLDAKVIIRTNLVILAKEGYTDLPEFYAKNKVEVVSSLPYYTEKNTDKQRGDGIFNTSISMLQKLNSLGYGMKDDLILNLVYNPCGAFLPPPQTAMENEYKKNLKNKYNIDFNNLFTITNNPVGRFLSFLEKSNNTKAYMERLYNSFNTSTLRSMMCRNQLSISWDGQLYDCDFNQALDLKVNGISSIEDLKGKKIDKRKIKFKNHCYACTAGSGSSCGGSTAN